MATTAVRSSTSNSSALCSRREVATKRVLREAQRGSAAAVVVNARCCTNTHSFEKPVSKTDDRQQRCQETARLVSSLSPFTP